MRSAALLGLALLASLAEPIAIPDQTTLNALSLENTEPMEQDSHPFWSRIDSAEKFWEELEKQFTKEVDSVEDKLKHVVDEVEDKFDDAADYSYKTAAQYRKGMQAAFAPKAWLGTGGYDLDLLGEEEEEPHHDDLPHGPPPYGPPYDGPPHHGPMTPREELMCLNRRGDISGE